MSDEPDWIDELYAEGAKERPPPVLDEKIRAAARAPVQRAWYRSPGRLTALATAASLVIAVSVIYFEPGQSVLDTRGSERAPQTPEHMERSADISLEEAEPGRFESEAVGAAKSMTSATSADEAEAKSTLAREMSNTPTDIPAETPAETPAAVIAAPAAPAPARRVSGAEAVPDQQSDDLSGTRVRLMERDLAERQVEEAIVTEVADQAMLAKRESAAQLVQLCGALPGTEETREIQNDEAGWLLIITVGDDVRLWRCVDGAWVETTSEQQ